MPSKIKRMDERLSMKIAAGEVVERPSSVVKELIENSLDAGATDISIEVKDGGRTLIRVVDNGIGMNREDALLAFARHATSKLFTEDDLLNIKTMGFRGEALYSISAVAKVSLKTRSKDENSGYAVTIEGGGDAAISEEGLPVGTIIEVKDLFYNMPARLKFLRAAQTEFGRILDVVKRISLAHPEARIKLKHGVNTSLDAKKGEAKERLADIFGAEILKDIIAIDSKTLNEFGYGVVGFIGKPEVSQATSASLYTYVNGRFVRDRGINKAIMDGYSGMVQGGRYPFAVVDVRLPWADVDVNVHPAKTEVRFKNTSFVFDLVRAAVSSALSGGKAQAGIQTPGNTAQREVEYKPGVPPKTIGSMQIDRGEGRGNYFVPTQSASVPEADFARQLSHGAQTQAELAEGFVDAAFVGQLWGEFLVFQKNDEFILIDQHGASERIRFERLKKARAGGALPSQRLLIPERLETTPEEKEALLAVMQELTRLGFEIIEFGASLTKGGETFLIKAAPDILSGRGSAAIIKDLVEELSNVGGSRAMDEKIADVLMRIACHSVVRGPRPMRSEEAFALYKDVLTIDFSSYCPHGRPVVKRITRTEVDKMFGRS